MLGGSSFSFFGSDDASEVEGAARAEAVVGASAATTARAPIERNVHPQQKPHT